MNTNTRNYSLDLLRLLATFMVVVLHVQLFGGLLREPQALTLSFLPTIFLESFCIVAVNCFVLITGFFMIHKTVNWHKLVNLLLEIAVISWAIFLIGTLCGLQAPLKELIQHIFPTLSGYHWFVSSYIIVYILSPWLNKFILSLTYKEALYLAGLLFVLFSVWGSNPKISVVSVQNGYSVMWLSYIYFLGSIIRLFGPKRLPRAGCIYIVFSLLTVIYAMILCNYIHSIRLAQNYNAPFVLFASIALFYAFYSLKISFSWMNKIIKFLTPGCFGVFLIHTDLFLRPFYKDLFAWEEIPVWILTLMWAFVIFSGSILIARYIHQITNWLCTKMLINKWIEQKVIPCAFFQLLITKCKIL